MSTEMNSTGQKRKSDQDISENPNSFNNEPALKKAKATPETPEQLADLLVPLESARILLQSKWPLKKIRTILDGAWIRYQSARDRQKVPGMDFLIDRVCHANRDGLRFRNSRENSYRNITKLKECETKLDDVVFEQWLKDLEHWEEQMPTIDELKAKKDVVQQAIEEWKMQENGGGQGEEADKPTEEAILPINSELSKADMSRLVITLDEIIRLLDYGKEVFERVLSGFYVEIRAPVNPNLKNISGDTKNGPNYLIYMDQIIGVNWMGKPYIVSHKPMTLSLKFRHFRDEKLRALPYRDKKTEIEQKVFDQWLVNMKEWEEELPTKEFINQKCAELEAVFAEAPKGPPIDLMKMVEGEKSAKLLRNIMEWQKEMQNMGPGQHPPPPPTTNKFAFAGPRFRPPAPIPTQHQHPHPPQTYWRAPQQRQPMPPPPPRYHHPQPLMRPQPPNYGHYNYGYGYGQPYGYGHYGQQAPNPPYNMPPRPPIPPPTTGYGYSGASQSYYGDYGTSSSAGTSQNHYDGYGPPAPAPMPLMPSQTRAYGPVTTPGMPKKHQGKGQNEPNYQANESRGATWGIDRGGYTGW